MTPSIVFTHGVFDLLHSNHIEMLRQAKCYGDYLLVAVHSDEIVRGYKRESILDENERLKQVSAVRYVDEAFIDQSELIGKEMERQIRQYNVSHYVYCGDGWEEHFSPAECRGILRRLPYHEGISSSGIIETMRMRIDDGSL